MTNQITTYVVKSGKIASVSTNSQYDLKNGNREFSRGFNYNFSLKR